VEPPEKEDGRNRREKSTHEKQVLKGKKGGGSSAPAEFKGKVNKAPHLKDWQAKRESKKGYPNQ